jgi:putative transposase
LWEVSRNPKEDKVAHPEYNTVSNEIKAQDVHRLTQEVLQANWQLDMQKRVYTAENIWDVVIAAAAERMTVEMACNLLEEAPSANTVRNALHGLWADASGMAEAERRVNVMLVERLPKPLLKAKLPAAIDLTEIPYHGQHEEEDVWVRRGQAKHGTTHFHVYATLYVVKQNKRYTLALMLVRRTDKMVDVLKRLLTRGQALGLRLKRLYLDRGFDNNGVIAYLQQQPFPTILPLVHRGPSGGSRGLLVGRKSYRTTYTRSSVTYGERTFPVFVVCKYSQGRYRRHGLVRFAYVVIGNLDLAPHQVFEEYRQRFAIETSYRLMNTVRARTTSTSVTLRLLLVAVAFLLLNLWSYVKWTHLFVPKRGPRQTLHHLLTLARWRLWLWEMVKQRLGFSLSVIVPLPA